MAPSAEIRKTRRFEGSNRNEPEKGLKTDKSKYKDFEAQKDKRTWTFAEIGKIHVLTEMNGKIEVKTETIIISVRPNAQFGI